MAGGGGWPDPPLLLRSPQLNATKALKALQNNLSLNALAPERFVDFTFCKVACALCRIQQGTGCLVTNLTFVFPMPHMHQAHLLAMQPFVRQSGSLPGGVRRAMCTTKSTVVKRFQKGAPDSRSSL